MNHDTNNPNHCLQKYNPPTLQAGGSSRANIASKSSRSLLRHLRRVISCRVLYRTERRIVASIPSFR